MAQSKLTQELWNDRAKREEVAADSKKAKCLYSFVKEIYSSKFPSMAPVRTADGSFRLTDTISIKKCWIENGCTLFKRSLFVDMRTI